MRIALVIPTLNEAESIGAVVGELPHDLLDRIIVADGGSTDATAERAARAGAEVIHSGRGYGRACFAGALAATDADIVVFMDGDGADDPRVIEALVLPIVGGERDFVIGSRVRGQGAQASMRWHQRWAGLTLGLLIKAFYGVRYTDMCALRAIRRDALLQLGMREMTYGWNLEMQLRAARGKLRILEIPVDNRPRFGGTSKVSGSLRGSLRAGAHILSTCLRLIFSPSHRANRAPGVHP